MTKILVLDFVTQYGGAQRVAVNLLKELLRLTDWSIVFLDAYGELRTKRAMSNAAIAQWELPLSQKRSLKWDGQARWKILMQQGPKYAWYLLRLALRIRRNDIDLLYTNSPKGAVLTAVAAFFSGIPFVYHAHGAPSMTKRQPLLLWAMRRAKRVVAVSNDVAVKLKAAGLRAERVLTIHNGVDLQQWAKSSPYVKIPDQPLRIMTASALQRIKGLHTAIDAIGCLRKRGVDIALDIFGEAMNEEEEEYRAELERQVASLGVEDAVCFCGWCDDPAKELAAHALLLLPSETESFGMVLAEAMAVGRAVVASAVDGIPEVVEDGRNGELVEVGNARNLAVVLQKLTENPRLLQNYGEQGRTRAEEKFSVTFQAGKIKRLIEELLEKEEERHAGADRAG